MTKTIAWVKQETRTWEGPNGAIVFVSGEFKDAQGWSIGCKPENAEARKAEMEALIGKEGEYELEPGKEFGGRPQWKMKAWPGKPQYGGGGGGFKGGGGGGARTWSEAYSQSREAHEVTQRSIQRACALERAVQVANGTDCGEDHILNLADKFFVWLSDRQPQTTTPQQPPANTNGHHETVKSKQFEDFSVWLKTQCSTDPNEQRKTWEHAKQIASHHGHNGTSLQACNSAQVFDAIKREMQAVHAHAGDDSLPF